MKEDRRIAVGVKVTFSGGKERREYEITLNPDSQRDFQSLYLFSNEDVDELLKELKRARGIKLTEEAVGE